MNLTKWLKDIASVFQPAADKIRAWKLPPDVDKLLDETWENLPKTIQTALWNFLKVMYDRYGEEVATILLRNLLGSLKTQNFIER